MNMEEADKSVTAMISTTQKIHGKEIDDNSNDNDDNNS
jgi:hypothetical protein